MYNYPVVLFYERAAAKVMNGSLSGRNAGREKKRKAVEWRANYALGDRFAIAFGIYSTTFSILNWVTCVIAGVTRLRNATVSHVLQATTGVWTGRINKWAIKPRTTGITYDIPV